MQFLVQAGFVRRGLVPALAVLSCSFAFAQGQGAGNQQQGGFVINQTVTVAGHDFYQHFALGWRERELGERFMVSVHEQPSARWGSRVWIEYAQRRVFQASLPPSRAAIRSISSQAVKITEQRIADTEAERLLFRDPDLATDEL